MHPDQKTPDSHRYRAPDSKREHAPDAPQQDDAIEQAGSNGSNVRTPEPEGKRLGEAGGEYVGRQMDDALKSTPREGDADEGQDED